jgi:SAM-dependent methyltransferase
MMKYIDDANLRFYEAHFEDHEHIMPNVNTVRCEIWYFRANQEPGGILDYGFSYGQELMYFAEQGYDVYGLDIVQATKDKIDAHIATKRPDLSGRITTPILDSGNTLLPYSDDFFDFIHSNQVIYFLPSREAI